MEMVMTVLQRERKRERGIGIPTESVDAEAAAFFGELNKQRHTRRR
jgi:hypothetical protein